jgi:hypothetical protein
MFCTGVIGWLYELKDEFMGSAGRNLKWKRRSTTKTATLVGPINVHTTKPRVSQAVHGSDRIADPVPQRFQSRSNQLATPFR